jgi:hypothetical protein
VVEESAVWLLSTNPLAFAAGNEAKPADEPPPAAEKPAKEPQKIDEFTEAERAVTQPANNPECVWLGRSVVNLLWRDDLDSALRNLDFYDRLGCPSRHIQASFRCLILHGSNIDPKAADKLEHAHPCLLDQSSCSRDAAAGGSRGKSDDRSLTRYPQAAPAREPQRGCSLTLIVAPSIFSLGAAWR